MFVCTAYGGGIYMVDSLMVVLDNSVISENEASINCGGAFLSQVPTINISKSSVFLNGLLKYIL